MSCTSEPLVTVLIAVFNENPKFLKTCLDSILQQSYTNLEIFVIDDGSDDPKTVEMLGNYSTEDIRVRLDTKTNHGLTKTLNYGIKSSKGSIICRQDSDDWSERNRIRKQVDFLQEHSNIGLVGSYTTLHQESGETLWLKKQPCESDEILDSFARMNPFVHGSVCFRKDLALSLGCYREELACSQDYDFFWRFCEKFGGANIAEPLYHRRFKASAISVLKAQEQRYSTLIIQSLAQMRANSNKEIFGKAVDKANQLVQNSFDKYKSALQQADNLMLAGSYRRAAKAIIEVITSKPSYLLSWLKLFRLAIFISLPVLRKTLFSR